jgi:AcrR family transcriptional regulator
VPRPKEFDPDKVLEVARSIFWKNGFEATSTEDLRVAMGIGRQSFYDTFGSKRQIFVEVLRKYSSDGIQECIATLRAEKSPLAALETLLLSFSKETPEKRARGCMGVAAMCELGVGDLEIAEVGKSSTATLESILEGLIREAKAEGEVRASVRERAAARQLNATILGMKVLAKGGASAEALRDIALSAIDGLRIMDKTVQSKRSK